MGSMKKKSIFAQRLKEYRGSLNQRDLANFLAVSTADVSALERDAKNPSLGLLQTITYLTKTPMDYWCHEGYNLKNPPHLSVDLTNGDNSQPKVETTVDPIDKQNSLPVDEERNMGPELISRIAEINLILNRKPVLGAIDFKIFHQLLTQCVKTTESLFPSPSPEQHNQ